MRARPSALAAFGEDAYRDLFDELLIEAPTDTRGRGSWFHLNPRYLNVPEGFLFLNRSFNQRALERLGPPREPSEPLTAQHRNLAASLQARLERFFIDLIPRLAAEQALPDLCMAGGVVLNGVLNGRLLREGHVRHLFVQPAAGDSGTSLGSAMYVAHGLLGQARSGEMRSCAMGPEFTGPYVVSALEHHGLEWRESQNVAEDAAALLAEGRIVGWFQGRMEFGPLRLGSPKHPGQSLHSGDAGSPERPRQVSRGIQAVRRLGPGRGLLRATSIWIGPLRSCC